ncbi:hypothetical protein GUJ93_ZPchr0001g33110 [Zizania palustris]|uniref:Pentacotripeptide-repeat region of PRORP domain-containing protein n=1 Tax=Zizania palustris TaxID=103762 RepID=A0A8J5UZN6_ZIZPA|nr:hypothetical protein GUJ93_ZPchr0001g33110 [Zizania palustris]
MMPPPPPPPPPLTVLGILRGEDPASLPSRVSTRAPLCFQHLRPSLPTVHDSALPALARWAAKPPHVSLLASRGLFAAAWRLLLGPSSASPPLAAFAPLVRRYSQPRTHPAALRTFHFLRGHPDRYVADGDIPAAASLLNMAVDALCKEGHPRAAVQLFERWRREEPDSPPDERTYNILLHGWNRAGRLDKVGKLWAEMRLAGVRPTVVTYGTLIEGLCVMRRPDQAIALLDEMREEGINANLITCNPIVYALAQAGRFQDAHKRRSQDDDRAGHFADHKDIQYFLMAFAKNGNIESGMNLYSKMINNGYSPDQLTYVLLIKMLSRANRLELVVQMIQEMRTHGFEPDLATSTMLIHLLCRRNQYEEACAEFEDMFKRGIVPQYITYQRLMSELKRLGLVQLVQKLANLMRLVPHSTKLPRSYRDKEGEDDIEKRKSILQKAQVVSNVLKEFKDTKELDMCSSADVSDCYDIVQSARRCPV